MNSLGIFSPLLNAISGGFGGAGIVSPLALLIQGLLNRKKQSQQQLFGGVPSNDTAFGG